SNALLLSYWIARLRSTHGNRGAIRQVTSGDYRVYQQPILWSLEVARTAAKAELRRAVATMNGPPRFEHELLGERPRRLSPARRAKPAILRQVPWPGLRRSDRCVTLERTYVFSKRCPKRSNK